jgi:tetratricopeptide (TPR) repeat protein
MVKQSSPAKLLTGVAAVAALVFLSFAGAFCQDMREAEARLHNQQGMEYFKKGFYDHAPRNQVADADRNYRLAVKELKAAIWKDSSYTEAHRNLARVYFVQKNFDGAAQEYTRVAELAPGDLDAYVNLALALIELRRSGEALQALENAKGHTTDPKALETLDSYIGKIRACQEVEVR